MKVTKYFPNWQISVGGKIYVPAGPGETPVAITGLPKDEIKRLLEMDAIRKVEFDDGTAKSPPAAKDKVVDDKKTE